MLPVTCTLLNLNHVYFIYRKLAVCFIVFSCHGIIFVNVISIVIMMVENKINKYLKKQHCNYYNINFSLSPLILLLMPLKHVI